jgi:hypothetical protein
METIFDWLTVLTFLGLVVLYLQRSSMPDPPDTIWHYLPAAIGCGLVNYLGNENYTIVAAAGIVAVFAYIYYVIYLRRIG